jgi:hypothetical protein
MDITPIIIVVVVLSLLGFLLVAYLTGLAVLGTLRIVFWPVRLLFGGLGAWVDNRHSLQSIALYGFPHEADLQRFLAERLHLIERGLRPWSNGECGEYEIVDDTGRVWRVDLLCRDSHGIPVVVELKMGRATREAVGQILAYMGLVTEILSPGRPARGIIVAEDFDEDVAWARQALQPRLSLRRHRFAGRASWQITDV